MPDHIPDLAWLFVDMNAFFASIEQHFNPALRGRAIAVLPVLSEGTSVIAASQQAKVRGVKTGTRVRDARALCPEIEFVRARPREYVRFHHRVQATIERCAPIHKTYSIDEWAIRLIGAERTPSNALDIARRIKAALLADYSPCITCSIGIAPTRLLAKIASDLHKPDGLNILNTPDLPHRLEHLTLKSLVGIGEGMRTRLEAAGITSIPELWNLSRRESIGVWGSVEGGGWWDGFHGIDTPEAAERRRTMSHSKVLGPDHRNDTSARAILSNLVSRLARRLRLDGYAATGLSISISRLDNSSDGCAAEFPPEQSTRALLESLYRLWDRRARSRAAPIKIGAVVTGLVPVDQAPQPLFAGAQGDARLSRAMDAIHRRWGTDCLYYGGMSGFSRPMEDKIAFGRIPSDDQDAPAPGRSRSAVT